MSASYEQWPVVIHQDAYELLVKKFRSPEVLEQWIHRIVPALGSVTPLQFVAAGHSWAEILTILDGMGEMRG